jgi:hypothetical protein
MCPHVMGWELETGRANRAQRLPLGLMRVHYGVDNKNRGQKAPALSLEAVFYLVVAAALFKSD